MKCRSCGKGDMLLIVTTRRYITENPGHPFPVVVSYYRCSNMDCKATIGAEHRKNYFCRYCGMLTSSKAQICDLCRRKAPRELKT